MTKSFGEIMINIDELQCAKPNVLAMVKEHWHDMLNKKEYLQYLKPAKYNAYTRLLTVESQIPPLYTSHLINEILANCKNIVGTEHIKSVKFTFKS